MIYVPTIPLLPWFKKIPKIGRYFSGYLASDHINAFLPSSLRFFCERAGFRTVKVAPFYPGPLSVLDGIPLANRLVDGCVYVGKKIEGWDYPEKATRRAAHDENGYVLKGK